MIVPSITVEAFAIPVAAYFVAATVFGSFGLTWATDADFREGFYDFMDYCGEQYQYFFYDKCSPWVQGVDTIVRFSGSEWNELRHKVHGWVEQNGYLSAIDVTINASDGTMGFEDNNSFSYHIKASDLEAGQIYFPAPKHGWTYHTTHNCDYIHYHIGDYYPFQDGASFSQDSFVNSPNYCHYNTWLEIDLDDGLIYYSNFGSSDGGKKQTDVQSKFYADSYICSSWDNGKPVFIDPANGTVFKLFSIGYTNTEVSNYRYQSFLTLNNRRLNHVKGRLYYADTGELAVEDYDYEDYGRASNAYEFYILKRMGYALPGSVPDTSDDDYSPGAYAPVGGLSIDKDYFPTKSVDETTGQDVYSGDVANDATVSVNVAGTREGLEEATKTASIAQSSVTVQTAVDYPDGVPKVDSGGLFDKFPFCIPKDIYNMVTCFYALPQAPVYEIPLKIWQNSEGSYLIDYTLTIDFSFLDPVIPIIRFSSSFIFVIGLILITRKVIGAQ